jgi:hypothetical protein
MHDLINMSHTKKFISLLLNPLWKNLDLAVAGVKGSGHRDKVGVFLDLYKRFLS